MTKILIIDDERAIRNTLKDVLSYEKYKVDVAIDGIEGLEMANATSYDLILCDIRMPQMDGIEVLGELQKITESPIVMISGHGNIDTAVDAIKKGAYDYISKPIDLNRLLVTVRNGIDRGKLVEETKILRKIVSETNRMVGTSASLQNVTNIIDKVAETDARVLITGENGTGKELVARQLHEKGLRSHAPLIEVNCAAIPSELIESQLFGHEKGSFTSAIKQRKGDFELAHGGTLFLDEIGDMSLSAQAKVLRALQESKITRVGGDKEISVNVRVIAATNKNLKQEIGNGNFREDLYHRLSVIIIEVPNLNSRKEDIPELVSYFVEQISAAHGRPIKKFSEEAIIALQKHDWTGNIRELHNVVERLLILCDNTISEDDIKKYL